MSLKSILNGKTLLDREFQDIIKQALPSKEQYSTITGRPPFSSYEPLVPYELTSSAEAGLVGTAFDYLARAMIARILQNGKHKAYLNLKALDGLNRIRNKIDSASNDIIHKEFINSLMMYMDYIIALSPIDNDIQEMSSEEINAQCLYAEKCLVTKNWNPLSDIDSLIPCSYFFAKLEQVFRNGGRLPENGPLELLSPPSERARFELSSMCKVFDTVFIRRGFVLPQSTVIFNPSFGTLSRACGGADADIYIDGTLYDFKSGKKTGYTWQEAAQIVSYFYFHWLENQRGEPSPFPSQLSGHHIERLSIYRARYGEIEYFNTDILPSDTAYQLLNHIGDRIKYLYSL